jgi:energy-coupling factor transporter transmembrane protein EcfT
MSIDNVKDQISDIIVSYSDTIDQYGKLGFKIVFSVLTVFVAAIAAIMLLLCFCSGKKCSNCCLFRCGFKIILHILWNILALLMILTFLIGTIFLLVGTIGGDLVSVVSYVVSSENLNKGEGEIALLGEAADKLTVCLNGNGDISNLLGINDETREQLELLKSYKRQLESLIIQFKSMGRQKTTYNSYNTKLIEREGYSTLDFGFKTDDSYIYKLKDVLNNANNENNYEELSFHCPANNKVTCDSTYTPASPKKCFDLNDCNDATIKSRYPVTDVDLNKYMEIIYEIILKQKTANSESVAFSIKKAINEINGEYDAFIRAETEGLEFFHGSIAGITDIFDSLVGDNDDFLSFLNCKFMGKNIKVVLKFLEKSLGGHFKTVGICLLLSGFSLAIAIMSTILLMSILKENAGK